MIHGMSNISALNIIYRCGDLGRGGGGGGRLFVGAYAVEVVKITAQGTYVTEIIKK